jgi:16S rRNA (adenine1518-N6/adenine1519-N6)-dimethyltransferase
LVVTVELDRRLLPALSLLGTGHANVLPLVADIMAIGPEAFAPLAPMKLVANLPYGVASPLLVDLAGCPALFPVVAVTVQKEVGRRLAASSGGKEYGFLTVAVATGYRARITRTLAPGSFSPPPKVDSAVVLLTALSDPLDPELRPGFLDFVKGLFSRRRKTIGAILRGTGREAGGVPPELLRLRPEQISPEGLLSLYRETSQNGAGGGGQALRN